MAWDTSFYFFFTGEFENCKRAFEAFLSTYFRANSVNRVSVKAGFDCTFCLLSGAASAGGENDESETKPEIDCQMKWDQTA